MLQKILQAIAREDTFKLFTNNAPNSVYEIASTVRDGTNKQEVQNAIMFYFNCILREHAPGTFYHAEALRVMKICDEIFASSTPITCKAENMPPPPPRDINDEVVDLYLESLNYFASGLDEPVLMEHIRYLEN